MEPNLVVAESFRSMAAASASGISSLDEPSGRETDLLQMALDTAAAVEELTPPSSVVCDDGGETSLSNSVQSMFADMCFPGCHDGDL